VRGGGEKDKQNEVIIGDKIMAQSIIPRVQAFLGAFHCGKRANQPFIGMRTEHILILRFSVCHPFIKATTAHDERRAPLVFVLLLGEEKLGKRKWKFSARYKNISRLAR
jgi:hypothetical protein